jgi:hypothetical protein
MSAPSPHDSEGQAAAKATDPSPDPALVGSRRPPKHQIHSVMNFEQLIAKVEQAEDALEARERELVADWRQLRASWRAGWTPGRVVIAGLASGFIAGRLQPGRVLAKGGGGLMQLLSTLSGLIASGSAQAAAGEAEHAAQSVEDVAAGATPASTPASAPAAMPPDQATRIAGAESARP